MEIMVVIMIIAVLMTFVVGAMQWVETRKNEEQARVTVARIAQVLQEFKAENGYLPDGDGSEASSGNLYKALFGDYKNTGVPNKDRSGKRNTVYMEELDPAQQGKTPLVMQSTSGQYLIVDPWGAPYRYRLGWQEKDSKGKEGPGQNPDFDIWSVGKDGDTNPKINNKTGPNEDDIGNM